MAYDIQRVLAALPALSTYLIQDGHNLTQKGGKFFTCCPFHNEKTGSFCVNDTRFHCFGCGERGDTIDYISRTRGWSIGETLKTLAAENGIIEHNSPPLPRATPPPAPIAAPLSASQQSAWQSCCQRLLDSTTEVQRIAQWRGISPDCIRHLASIGLMGIGTYWRATRETFLVVRPEGESQIPISLHHRLGPHTPGNDDDKASWRYDPPKCGAWPFIIGNPARADFIFICEGQWDAIALMSVMEWHKKFPARTCLVGLRGSTSGKKFLDYDINPKATVFAFADSDAAGEKWFDPDGFLALLSERTSKLHAWLPSSSKRDLNDLIKDGTLTREIIMDTLRQKLPNPNARRKHITFSAWLYAHKDKEAPHHAAFILNAQDKNKPQTNRRDILVSHWKKHHKDADTQILTTAYDHYMQTR